MMTLLRIHIKLVPDVVDGFHQLFRGRVPEDSGHRWIGTQKEAVPARPVDAFSGFFKNPPVFRFRSFEVFVKPGIFQGNGDLGAEVLDHLESPGGEGSLNQVIFQVNDAAQGGLDE